MLNLQREFVNAVIGHVQREFQEGLAGVAGVDEGQRDQLVEMLGQRLTPEGVGGAIRDRMDDLRSRVLMILRADWRMLLRSLTDGDPTLSDALFDRLVHTGRPSDGHQVLALLTESLGWKLWLTTNFDTLIELALREQGIDPVVFELPENGPVPDARLLRDSPSVVKLHGGSFALRVGDSLDAALSPPDLMRFVGYFPDDALVLVIGYGGGDRRVMSLIEHLVMRHIYVPEKKRPKVLWVYRDEAPPPAVAQAGLAAQRYESVAAVRYRSGGLFLRELHARLVGLHPAGQSPYVALPMVAPFSVELPADADGHGLPHATARRQAPALKADPGQLARGVIIVVDRSHRAGASQPLAELVRGLDGSHQSIWCELAEFPSVHALVEQILRRISRFDPDFTPRAFVPPAGKSVEQQRARAIETLTTDTLDIAAAHRARGKGRAAARPPVCGGAAARQVHRCSRLDRRVRPRRVCSRQRRAALPLRAQRRPRSGQSGDPVETRTAPERAAAASPRQRAADAGQASQVENDRFDEVVWQTLLLCAFLKCVIRGTKELASLGQSKLCAAMYPLSLEGPAEKNREVAAALFKYVNSAEYLGAPIDVRSESSTQAVRNAVAGVLENDAKASPEFRDAVQDLQDRLVDTHPGLHETLFECLVLDLHSRERGAARVTNGRDHIERAADYWAFLEIAAAFRRPRSRVNLINLAGNKAIFPGTGRELFPDLLRTEPQDDRPAHRDATVPAPSSPVDVSCDRTFSDVFRRLDVFRLLVHSEGGFYWMNSRLRNAIYKGMYTPSWPLAQARVPGGTGKDRN